MSCNATAFLNGKLPKLCAMLHPYIQSTMEKSVLFCLCKCDLIEMEEIALQGKGLSAHLCLGPFEQAVSSAEAWLEF